MCPNCGGDKPQQEGHDNMRNSEQHQGWLAFSVFLEASEAASSKVVLSLLPVPF